MWDADCVPDTSSLVTIALCHIRPQQASGIADPSCQPALNGENLLSYRSQVAAAALCDVAGGSIVRLLGHVCFFAVGALCPASRQHQPAAQLPHLPVLIFGGIALTVIVGLRFHVAADWANYVYNFSQSRFSAWAAR